LPRLAAAEGLFLFGIKKKQKMPAENFSFEASCAAWTAQPEKFVRPDLSRTGIPCYGLAGLKCKAVKILINNNLQNNVNGRNNLLYKNQY
jgi:alanine racemase